MTWARAASGVGPRVTTANRAGMPEEQLDQDFARITGRADNADFHERSIQNAPFGIECEFDPVVLRNGGTVKQPAP